MNRLHAIFQHAVLHLLFQLSPALHSLGPQVGDASVPKVINNESARSALFGPLRHANRKKAGAAALGLPSALNIRPHACNYTYKYLNLSILPSHAQHDWSETFRIASPFWRGKPGASFHLVAYTVFFLFERTVLSLL